MNKRKHTFLIVILIIIVLLIIGMLLIYLINKNNGEVPQKQKLNINGKWVADSVSFTNNDTVTNFDVIEDKYIIISDDKIKICYYVSEKDICNEYNYTLANNIIKIDENELYLSGENELSLENNRLAFKKIYNGNKYTLLIFERE